MDVESLLFEQSDGDPFVVQPVIHSRQLQDRVDAAAGTGETHPGDAGELRDQTAPAGVNSREHGTLELGSAGKEMGKKKLRRPRLPRLHLQRPNRLRLWLRLLMKMMTKW